MRGKLLWERQDKLIFSAKLHSGNLIAFCLSIFSDMTLTWHVNMLQCSLFNHVECWFYFFFFLDLGLHICIGYFFSQHNNFHIFNVLWKNQYPSSQEGRIFQVDCKELLNTHRWPLTPKVKVCRSNVELFKKISKISICQVKGGIIFLFA